MYGRKIHLDHMFLITLFFILLLIPANVVVADFFDELYWEEKTFVETLNGAKQGNADAQFQLGKKYDAGIGVPKNINEARKWYTKAAEQGHVEAQKALAAMGIGGHEKTAFNIVIFFAVFCGIIIVVLVALVFALIKKKEEKDEDDEDDEDEQSDLIESTEVDANTRKCPYCAEEIKADAVKCKHCGEWLNKKDTKQKTASITIDENEIEGKGNFFWPSVDTVQNAKKVLWYGIAAAIFSAVITTLVATVALTSGQTVFGYANAWAYLDAVIVAAIAFGIYKENRFAAVFGLFLFLLEKAHQFMQNGNFKGAWVAIILTFCYINAIRAAFALSKLRQASDARRNMPRAQLKPASDIPPPTPQQQKDGKSDEIKRNIMPNGRTTDEEDENDGNENETDVIKKFIWLIVFFIVVIARATQSNFMSALGFSLPGFILGMILSPIWWGITKKYRKLPWQWFDWLNVGAYITLAGIMLSIMINNYMSSQGIG